jgi:thiol-disulfide isomerase/thioredoxin
MKIKNDFPITRRRAVAGAAVTIVAAKYSPAIAENPSLAHGMLANNKLAKTFADPPRDTLPDVSVDGLDGQHTISSLLQGRTVVMPVWAEWCGPCLRELPDFALLQREYGSAKFAIIPILSDPRHQMTPQIIADVFAHMGASVFQPLMETKFGRTLAMTMGRVGETFGLPCNLLIRPDGRVIGRETGLEEAADATAAGWQSVWGGKDGQEFAAAMANGFLN